VVEIEDIFGSVDGKLVRAPGFPPHEDRFVQHGIDLPALLAVRGGEAGLDTDLR